MPRKKCYFLSIFIFGICTLIFKLFLLRRYGPVILGSSESSRTATAQLKHRGQLATFLAQRREDVKSFSRQSNSPKKTPVPFRSSPRRYRAGTVFYQREDNKAVPNQGSSNVARVLFPPDPRYMAQPMKADVPASAQKKTILVFNRPGWLFDDDPHYQKVFDTCPYKCTMTDDRHLLSVADAVWVDVACLNDRKPPGGRPPHQMWVAYNIESPVHFIGHIHDPAWRTVFNWTFSYRTDSDFFRPYGNFQFRSQPSSKNYAQIMSNKTKPIAWFVSNCHAPSLRQTYVEELKKYIDVDIYGSCGRLKCPGLAEEKCFRVLNTTYYFYLAFENSYCGDYVTEKLFKTYQNLNIIPIVRGAVNYMRYLPPNTFLDAANFSSPEQLAQHLHRLMKDVQGYTDMLRTKDRFLTTFTSWVRPNLRPFCELCRALQVSPPPPKVYPDIVLWTQRAKCWAPKTL